jgi:hypothetical protein
MALVAAGARAESELRAGSELGAAFEAVGAKPTFAALTRASALSTGLNPKSSSLTILVSSLDVDATNCLNAAAAYNAVSVQETRLEWDR